MAVHRLSDAVPFVVGELGGRAAKGGDSRAFRWRQWRYDGGGRLEILEPAGPAGGFLHRFLEQRGPGVHHVTLHVGDLDLACREAESLGFEVVGRDDSDPSRKEAFLHPGTALGIVVQLVEAAQRGDSDTASGGPLAGSLPDDPVPAPPGIGLFGLRLACGDLSRARALWCEVLAAEMAVVGSFLVARWPGSPVRLAIVERHDVEGPIAIELVCLRPVVLPQGPHPVLGATFEPVDPEAALAGPSVASTDENDEQEPYVLDSEDLEP